MCIPNVLLLMNLVFCIKQGRLEPVQAFLKKNKRGLGAEKARNKEGVGADKKIRRSGSVEDSVPDGNSDTVSFHMLCSLYFVCF